VLPPNPLDGYKGSTSKGREARARKGRGPTSMAIGRGGRKERRGKGVKGREGDTGKGSVSPKPKNQISPTMKSFICRGCMN